MPKVQNPNPKLTACSNAIYKFITKLTDAGMKLLLPHLVDESQGAFVTSKSILHNITITEDFFFLGGLWIRNGFAKTWLKCIIEKAYRQGV